MSILILLTYPLFSHVFVISGHPFWAAVYLLGLIGLFLIQAILKQNLLLVLIMTSLLVTGTSLVMQNQSTVLMYLPPVMINLGLLLLFGRSLKHDHIPIITRYAQLIDGHLDQQMSIYTKRVTQVWTILFFVLLIESICLSIFSPIVIWSLFTNFVNYILVIVIFVAEYIYRNVVYPDLPKRSFLQFLYQLLQIRPSQLRV